MSDDIEKLIADMISWTPHAADGRADAADDRDHGEPCEDNC